MNDSMTIKGIEKELERLGQTRWMPVIVQLDEHFRGYPLEDDTQQPATAIHHILKTLSPDDFPEVRLVYQMQQLDCFSYRAYYTSDNQQSVYWNPLQESYEAFEDGADEAILYQVDSEYPPCDIIRSWMYAQVKQQ